MKTAKVLTVCRKADRQKIAALLTEQLQSAGAKVTRGTDLESALRHVGNDRCIVLEVKTERSLAVTVNIDGKSPHSDRDTFVLSWHFAELRTNERISSAFSNSVNEFHRHKATHVCYGFDDLLATLLHSIAMAKDGTAFERPVQTIEAETDLLPEVIADAVVREVELWSGAELEARSVLVNALADKAETIYKANAKFRGWMNRSGTQGRDTLYAFMRHWLTGQVNWYVNGKRLPDRFANGIKLQGVSV